MIQQLFMSLLCSPGLGGCGGSGLGGCGGGGGFCFALNQFVLDEKGAQIPLSNLKLATKVLCFNTQDDMATSTSKVIADLDSDFQQLCTFVQLKTKDGSSVELTEKHLILKKDKDSGKVEYTFAHKVAVGDLLKHFDVGWVEVESKLLVESIGYCCPLTNIGSIIVNGFHCSCFAHVQNHELIARYLPLLMKLYTSFKEDYKEERNLGVHPLAQELKESWLGRKFLEE